MAKQPEHECETAPARKASPAEWVKLMMGGGFGVVIAYILVQALVGRDESNTQFQQTTIIQVHQVMTDLKAEVTDLKSEIVSLKDENANLRRELYPLTRVVDKLVKTVAEQVEAVEAVTGTESQEEQP